MPIAEIDGQSLHYIDKGQGFPVLLGHSYLWHSTMWAPQIEELSQRYRVIVPDLWGHGGSGPLPERTKAIADLSRQALALLDKLDIRQCALVGLSVGGMWGTELALQAPSRIKCLVLMDTYLGPEPAPSQARYFAMLDQIHQLGVVPAPLLDMVVPLFFNPAGDASSPMRAAFRQELAALPAERLRDSIVPLGRMIFGRGDLRPRLGELNGERTLLLTGDKDIPRPPSEAQEMADIIGCRFVLVPDAGHISNLENPVFVTQTLLTFLGKHC
ncbi:MAG: alpha/beta fold hydrolase [Dongiaceae bacterium]